MSTLKPKHIPRRRTIAIAIAVLLVIALLTVAALIPKTRRAAPAESAPAPNAASDTLEFLASDVLRVTPRQLRRVLPLSGALRAIDQATVKAKVSGEIRAVKVREGEAVSAGQILIEMDTTEYKSRVEQARGALVAQRGQLDIATQTRANNRALVDKGFISRNAFDNAASQYDIAKANVDSARGALEVAQKALADTVIRAPISGLISSRSVEPGEKVAVDNALLKVVDLRKMEMEAPVPTADILGVKLNQAVTVSVEGLPSTLTGTVARINPATETGSRSIMVYIRVDNPDGLLRGGMFGDAQLTLASKDAVLAVPPTALQEVDGKRFVYVIRAGRLAQQQVATGMRGVVADGGSAVEIVSGLQAGDSVVKNNLGNLRVGSIVHVAGQSALPAKE